MINSTSNPALTYTLDDFISMKYNDEITFHNFSIVEVLDGVELLDHNVLEDYENELVSICIDCPLTDEQYKKYKYAPDQQSVGNLLINTVFYKQK